MEVNSGYVTQAGLDLNVPCICLPNPVVTGLYHNYFC